MNIDGEDNILYSVQSAYIDSSLCLWSFSTYSISSCFNKTVLRGLYIYIYYNISKCTPNSSCTHAFNRESHELGVHTLKEKRRAKEKNKLYSLRQ
jgi:hypothetical protein